VNIQQKIPSKSIIIVPRRSEIGSRKGKIASIKRPNPRWKGVKGTGFQIRYCSETIKIF